MDRSAGFYLAKSKVPRATIQSRIKLPYSGKAALLLTELGEFYYHRIMQLNTSLPSKVGTCALVLGIGLLLLSLGWWNFDFFSDAYFDHSPPYFFLGLPAAFFLYFGTRLQFGKPLGTYCRFVGWQTFPMALFGWYFLWSLFEDSWGNHAVGSGLIFVSVISICPFYMVVTKLLLKIDRTEIPALSGFFSKGGIFVISLLLFFSVSEVMQLLFPVPYGLQSNDGLKAVLSLTIPIFVSVLFYKILVQMLGLRAPCERGRHQSFRLTKY